MKVTIAGEAFDSTDERRLIASLDEHLNNLWGASRSAARANTRGL
jgi:hypothetical protein